MLMLGFAGSALALDRTELDQRIRKLTLRFELMQSKPDKRVPAENLRKAQGIILLDSTMGGLIVGYESGHGVALVRNPQTKEWSAPVFLQSNQGSLGCQIGGQHSFQVMLLMNSDATRQLGEAKADFGGEARGTAGGETAGAEGTVTASEPWVLVYDDRAGLYGGAALKGGAVAPDNQADLVYYDKPLTVNEIVMEGKAQPTDAGKELAAKINQWANRTDESMPASARR